MSVGPRTPVLIGVGQVVNHWDGADPAQAPSPASLRLAAAKTALADTGAAERLAGALDVVAIVRTNLDSVTGQTSPFPSESNPPRALAADLGLSVRRAIYSEVGGHQPQALVNEFAEAIFAGEATAVLLAGAEAVSATKAAARRRVRLDWSRAVDGEMEDRGLGPALLSDYEITNGLGRPTQTYPLFEHALRARLGLSRDEHRRIMSELLAGFSKVAAANPFAQFPMDRSAAFLATPSAENYPVADPYLKWHVAQDAVNQGAAVVLTSLGEALRLGVSEDRLVYLHGYAEVADRFVSERPDLSRSRAIEAVLTRAIENAGVSATEIAHYDLYSCFPCAVFIAAEALGLDWRERSLTVTGGLPFFGGPGNNYSMHAIASLVERLRQDRGAFGLVLANGGFLSKEAAGVYSTKPVEAWRPTSSADLQAAIDAQPAPQLGAETTDATIESFTVTYAKGSPQRGVIMAKAGDQRILARALSGHRATLHALAKDDPIGQAVRVRNEGANYICASDAVGTPAAGRFLERSFKHVRAERRGHVLEITLDRPDQMNALHSAAHFELHEIFDEFEADRDLWIAIITGAGERAFCSGNDLKATAAGGDMTTPGSGFAGLCSRFDREKPVIAAVNGVAMGGGLEIVLACDLAVADEAARFALPEVRVGLFAAAGGVQRLSRQIGRKAAMELILTGRPFTAERALELGIVNTVAPSGQSLQAARDLADAVVANSPSAVRASKAALNKLEEIESLKAAMAANGPIFGRLMRTQDFKEGVSAFVEKRSPQWSNR
jgi:acetyl-CoA C-acetyltransferase